MKRIVAMMTLAAAAATPLAAQAQFAKPEDAVKYRKSAFSVMGTHFGRIGAVVKGERPYDKAAVELDAAAVEFMSKLPWQAFGPGTDAGETKAKPEIWKEQDKFRAAADKMTAEVSKLSAAARSGDQAMLKAAFGNAAQSCKACHDNYRNK